MRDAAAPTRSPADAGVFGRAVAVAGVLLGAKLAIVLGFRRGEGFGLTHKVFAFGPDVMVAIALVAAMACARRRGQPLLIWLADAVALLAVLLNTLLTLVLLATRSYLTVMNPQPLLHVDWGSIVHDFATRNRLTALAVTLGVFLVGPAVARRFRRRRPGRGAVAALFAAELLYLLAGPLTDDPDAFRVLISLHPNPLLHYFTAGLTAQRLDLDGVGPAGPPEIATQLLPGARDADLDEGDDGIAVLRGERANVIVAIMESTNAAAVDVDDDSGSENHPFLSHVRERAAVFRRYSTPVPDSRGALASIFCSRYPLPRQYGGTAMEVVERGCCRPLADVLERHEVRTGFFMSSSFSDWIPQTFYESLRFGTLRDGRAIAAERKARELPTDASDGRIPESDTVTELLAWVDERCAAHEPFFGVYYTWVPHAPYLVDYAGGFAVSPDLADHERYRRLVRLVDEQLERVDAHLANRDCGRSNALLVTGDHGEAFNEHPNNVFHGVYIYEENIRVPLFVIHPKLSRIVSDRAASHVDLAPTVVDLMLGENGVRDEELGYEGRSLLRAATPWPVFFTSFNGSDLAGVRFGQFKLIERPGSWHLFDTDHDPSERVDIEARYPRLTSELRRGIKEWIAYERVHCSQALDRRGGNPTRSWRRG